MTGGFDARTCRQNDSHPVYRFVYYSNPELRLGRVSHVFRQKQNPLI